jgi:hypothetical protein
MPSQETNDTDDYVCEIAERISEKQLKADLVHRAFRVFIQCVESARNEKIDTRLYIYRGQSVREIDCQLDGLELESARVITTITIEPEDE